MLGTQYTTYSTALSCALRIDTSVTSAKNNWFFLWGVQADEWREDILTNLLVSVLNQNLNSLTIYK